MTMMKNVPEIRFKGCYDEDGNWVAFTHPWEQRKLSDEFADFIVPMRDKPKEFGGNIPWTRIEDIEGKYLNDSLSGQYVTEETVKKMNLKIIPKDSLIVSSSATFGVVAVITQDLITNQTFIGLVPNNKDTLDYWYAFFHSDEPRKYMRLESAGSTIFYIARESFENMPIKVPSKDEMIKIGSYFDNLDHLITLHQQKCEQTKNLKKYMLQKMFPQNGAKVPEIRFNGFTHPWEQRKFGDLADYKKGPFGSAITKDMFVPKSEESIKVYEQQNAINKDWELERYFLPKEYALTKLKLFEVHGGDIIVSCAGTIGEIYEIPENADTGVINQALMRVRVDEDCVDKRMFKIAFSNMIDDFTRVHSNGSAIKNIPPFSDLKPMGVLLPSLQEQKRIGAYFDSLDHLITLHQRKADIYKKLKKCMLQKMFPHK